MVVDAEGSIGDNRQLAGKALSRTEVLNGPLAARAYAVVDAIWLQDTRIAELVSDAA